VLNKAICWKCVQGHIGFLNVQSKEFVAGYFKGKWEGGTVYCSVQNEFPSYEEPPDRCPYLLEQLLALTDEKSAVFDDTKMEKV
jgi:hypothetical protein